MSDYLQRHDYIGSSDNFSCCPLKDRSDKPVRFVAIGVPGAMHALSFLQDVRPVSSCLLFNVDQEVCENTGAAMRLWRQCALERRSRESFVKDWLGLVLRDRPRDWRDLDMKQTGRTSVIGPETDTNRLRLDPTDEEASKVVEFRFTGKDKYVSSFGWDYGYLDEAAFYVPPPEDIQCVTSKASDAITKALRSHKDETVVWMSNIATFTDVDPVVHWQPGNTTLHRWAKRAKTYPWYEAVNLRYGAPSRLKLCYGKHVPSALQPSELNKSPSRRVDEQVDQLRLPGMLLVVYPNMQQPSDAQLAKIPHSDCLVGGPDDFLDNDALYSTINLHILSCQEDVLNRESFLTQVIEQCKQRCQRLLILEHNPWTLDRLHTTLHNEGTPVSLWRSLVGRQEDQLVWCRGEHCLRRNYIAIFDFDT